MLVKFSSFADMEAYNFLQPKGKAFAALFIDANIQSYHRVKKILFGTKAIEEWSEWFWNNESMF